LVVVAGVQGQLAEQLSGVAVDHPDVSVVDEEADRGAGQPDAEADVVQPAVVVMRVIGSRATVMRRLG